jgi:hypothetical protein
LETQVKDESKTIHGCIPWTGGECPVSGDVEIEILVRNQRKEKGRAGWCRWCHIGDSNDIIGYRVIK